MRLFFTLNSAIVDGGGGGGGGKNAIWPPGIGYRSYVNEYREKLSA